MLTELDYELSAMCDTIMYRCSCGAIDMHGQPLFEYFGHSREMTGIMCRSCWDGLLVNWVKA